MSIPRDTSFGNPSLIEKVGCYISLTLHMPFTLGWTLLTSPIHPKYRYKNWKRVLCDRMFHHLTERLNVKQLQWLLGTTRVIYEDWAKKNDIPIVVDELGEGAQLLWIGERRTDRVILYFHGGAYLFGIQSPALPFWKYVKTELKSKNMDAGLALLTYSFVPTASFPTQLKQATLALQHLISTGTSPHNIQLTGDSAGANIALSLISHLLHPVPDVPKLTLSAPLRGLYLMSPWASLSTIPASMAANDDSDILGLKCLPYWGLHVLQGVPDSHRPYLEAADAPDTWFAGIEGVVERVLFTAGDAECLRDIVVRCAQKVMKHHDRAELVIQKHGVHNDPFLDFLTGEKVLGELTPLIVEWFAAGFDASLR